MALHPPGEGQAAIQHTKAWDMATPDTAMDTTMATPTNRDNSVPNRQNPRINHPSQNNSAVGRQYFRGPLLAVVDSRGAQLCAPTCVP